MQEKPIIIVENDNMSLYKALKCVMPGYSVMSDHEEIIMYTGMMIPKENANYDGYCRKFETKNKKNGKFK